MQYKINYEKKTRSKDMLVLHIHYSSIEADSYIFLII